MAKSNTLPLPLATPQKPVDAAERGRGRADHSSGRVTPQAFQGPRAISREWVYMSETFTADRNPMTTNSQILAALAGVTGPDGRTSLPRTRGWRNQNPLPYRLATPQDPVYADKRN